VYDSTPVDEALVHEAHRYARQAIEPSTRRTYNVGQRQFRTFCIEQGLVHNGGGHLPASPQTVVYFVTYLAMKGLAYKTIKLYLSAIKFDVACSGSPDVISTNFALQQVLRGIKKSNSNPRLIRLPITINVLSAMEAHLHSVLNALDRVMWRACMRLAFYGFLRVSEFVAPSPHQFDPETHLGAADVSFYYNTGGLSHMSIHIKQSKTDPFRVGQTIFIGATCNARCPVQALQAYMSMSPPGGDISRGSPSPLFVLQSGIYLTRATFVQKIKHLLSLAGISPSNHNSHSFRSGAVTTCSHMSASVSDSTIRALGRCKSDAHHLYDRASQQACIEVTQQMSCLLPGELRFGGL
jgi:hypothetical protein